MWSVPDTNRAFGQRERAGRLVVLGAGTVGRQVVETCRKIAVVRRLMADALHDTAGHLIPGAPEPACLVFNSGSFDGSAAVDGVLLAAKLESPAALASVRSAIRRSQARGQRVVAVLAVPVAPAATLRPGAFQAGIDLVSRVADTLILTAYRDPVPGIVPGEMALPDHQTAELVLLRVVDALCDAATGLNSWPLRDELTAEFFPLARVCHAGYGVAADLDGRAIEAAREAVAQIRAARGRHQPVSLVLVYFGRGEEANYADLLGTEQVIQRAWPGAVCTVLRSGDRTGARRDFPVTLIASGNPTAGALPS